MPEITLGNYSSRVTINTHGAGMRWSQEDRPILYSKKNHETHPCGTFLSSAGCLPNAKERSVVRGFPGISEWTPVRRTPEMIELELANIPDLIPSELSAEYPTYFLARLAVTLEDRNTLHSRLVYQHAGLIPAPANISLHTYFPWESGINLVDLSDRSYEDWHEGTRMGVGSLINSALYSASSRDWTFSAEGINPFRIAYPDETRIVMSDNSSPRIGCYRVRTEPDQADSLRVEPMIYSDTDWLNHKLPVGKTIELDITFKVVPPERRRGRSVAF